MGYRVTDEIWAKPRKEISARGDNTKGSADTTRKQLVRVKTILADSLSPSSDSKHTLLDRSQVAQKLGIMGDKAALRKFITLWKKLEKAYSQSIIGGGLHVDGRTMPINVQEKNLICLGELEQGYLRRGSLKLAERSLARMAKLMGIEHKANYPRRLAENVERPEGFEEMHVVAGSRSTESGRQFRAFWSSFATTFSKDLTDAERSKGAIFDLEVKTSGYEPLKLRIACVPRRAVNQTTLLLEVGSDNAKLADWKTFASWHSDLFGDCHWRITDRKLISQRGQVAESGAAR